jgi:hypothetical protein
MREDEEDTVSTSKDDDPNIDSEINAKFQLCYNVKIMTKRTQLELASNEEVFLAQANHTAKVSSLADILRGNFLDPSGTD